MYNITLYILKKYNVGKFTDTSNNQNVLGNITAFSCTITSNTIEGTSISIMTINTFLRYNEYIPLRRRYPIENVFYKLVNC